MCIRWVGVRWAFMGSAERELVLVVVSKVRSMSVTVVKVVDVVVVLHRWVAAVWAVLVLVSLGFEVSFARDATMHSAV